MFFLHLIYNCNFLEKRSLFFIILSLLLLVPFCRSLATSKRVLNKNYRDIFQLQPSYMLIKCVDTPYLCSNIFTSLIFGVMINFARCRNRPVHIKNFHKHFQVAISVNHRRYWYFLDQQYVFISICNFLLFYFMY